MSEAHNKLIVSADDYVALQRDAAKQEHHVKMRIVSTEQERIFTRLADQGYDLSAETAFVFSAEISNTSVDAYFSHMHLSTLQNFSAGASDGVSLLDSHDARKLGVGYSCGSRVEREVEDPDKVRVIADFYIVRGLSYGGNYSYETSDDFMRAIETGVVRDVSVGFYGGRHICDICRKNVWSWDCRCWPGETYDVTDPETGEEEQVVATYTIFDAILSEVSLVYDGATPSAMILKAVEGVSNGELSEKFVRSWAATNRVNVRLTSGGNMSKKDEWQDDAAKAAKRDKGEGGDTGKDVVPRAKLDEALRRINVLEGDLTLVRDAIMETGAEEGVTLSDAITGLWNDLTKANARIATLDNELRDQAKWVDRGKRYHADLIADVITQGSRAMGDKFPAESQKRILADAPIDDLVTLRNTYKAQGDALLGSGGPNINDDAERRNGDGGSGPDQEWQPEHDETAYG